MSDIKRGEIYWVDWGEGKGSEQAGVRPALIIQNDVGNRASPTTIIASLTTAPNKPYPFLVECTKEESGLGEDGAVDLAAIQTIDKVRLGNRSGQLTSKKMSEVDKAIKISLGLV